MSKAHYFWRMGGKGRGRLVQLAEYCKWEGMRRGRRERKGEKGGVERNEEREEREGEREKVGRNE